MIMIGCPNSKNVPTSTSSPSEISLTMVWLTQPLLVVGALSWPFYLFTVDDRALCALPALLGFTTLSSKVSDTPGVEAQRADYYSSLGCTRWYMLQRMGRCQG
jgi:hypothetical protein